MDRTTTNELLADWARFHVENIPFDADIDIADLDSGVHVKWVQNGRWLQKPILVTLHAFVEQLVTLALGRMYAEMARELESFQNTMPDRSPEYDQGMRDALAVIAGIMETIDE